MPATTKLTLTELKAKRELIQEQADKWLNKLMDIDEEILSRKKPAGKGPAKPKTVSRKAK